MLPQNALENFSGAALGQFRFREIYVPGECDGMCINHFRSNPPLVDDEIVFAEHDDARVPCIGFE